MVVISWQSNAAVVWLKASALVYLRIAQIWNAANTKYGYCWTSANLQKQTGTDSIYSGPNVVQDQ